MAALTGLQKTQWTKTPQIITDWKLHTGLQATWILCLSPSSYTLGPRFPNEMMNLLSFEKECFGKLINSAVPFLLSPGKRLLMLPLVQEWLDRRNVTLVAHV
ncbi:hypothetical protein CHARACLAT_028218 [Characodon lateralis]|uniref:Uncharacterized protein n=1 Tax=Characodon lateralis TaxID=208331 RepID=A0ABU7DWK8_9TELE|nr:hypothetical protein [Characodon lateralis]